MVKKSSKKKDNKVIYAGAIIAIIAISSLVVYAQTNIFTRADEIPAQYGLTEPTPPEGSILDQSNMDATTQFSSGTNCNPSSCTTHVQTFMNTQEYLKGFGAGIRVDIIGDNAPCYFGISTELPDDPWSYTDWVALGVLNGNDLEEDQEYYVWFELPTAIQVTADQTHYLISFTQDALTTYYHGFTYSTDTYSRGMGGQKSSTGDWLFWDDVTEYTYDFRFFTWTTDEGPPPEEETPPSTTTPYPILIGGISIGAVAIGYVGVVGRKNGKKK